MVDRSARERGLKAAINNPRVSEQAKERDRELLRSEFGAEEPEVDAASEEPTSRASKAKSAKSKLATETGTIHQSNKQTSTSKMMAASSSSEMAEPVVTGRTRRSSGVSASKPPTSSIAGASDDLGGKDRGNVIDLLTRKWMWGVESAKEKDRKKLRDLGESPE
ncbi:hypothetical protein B0T19DRAFT_400957 [Cercophora scortea]|uniref:Uncharacterized protein n=1 Tax=Cercophora scortea TaxID=314031 RepID=A0AAE0INJ3_9PEZI|nr:hypothetical protein B0T19DRAFT_400957 [Cercophora scortea]